MILKVVCCWGIRNHLYVGKAGFQNELITLKILSFMTIHVSISGEGVYNSWATSLVYIEILDANDNDPIWQIPIYPEQTRLTENIYFGIIDRNAKPEISILTVFVSC